MLGLSNKPLHTKIVIAMFFVFSPLAILGCLNELVNQPMSVLITAIIGSTISAINARKDSPSTHLNSAELLMYSSSIVIGVNAGPNENMWLILASLLFTISIVLSCGIIISVIWKLITNTH